RCRSQRAHPGGGDRAHRPVPRVDLESARGHPRQLRRHVRPGPVLPPAAGEHPVRPRRGVDGPVPLVSMIVRSEFGLEPGYLPLSWFDLATPGPMLTDLFLTGYYPVLQWLSYILLGMAVAKLDINRHLLAVFTAGLG